MRVGALQRAARALKVVGALPQRGVQRRHLRARPTKLLFELASAARAAGGRGVARGGARESCGGERVQKEVALRNLRTKSPRASVQGGGAEGVIDVVAGVCVTDGGPLGRDRRRRWGGEVGGEGGWT